MFKDVLTLHFWSKISIKRNFNLQQFVPGAKKGTKWQEKGQTGGQIPCVGPLWGFRGSLTRFVHIWPSLRKLVHGCVRPRPEPFSNPHSSLPHSTLTPHSCALNPNLDLEWVLFCILSSPVRGDIDSSCLPSLRLPAFAGSSPRRDWICMQWRIEQNWATLNLNTSKSKNLTCQFEIEPQPMEITKVVLAIQISNVDLE